MTTIREWLKGKKTYMVAVTTIIAAVIAYADGDLDLPKLAEAVVSAILAVTIRAGVAKAEAAAK